MAVMLNAGAGARGLSTITTRAILNSIATRLDEGRELSRYLVGLLVFLGLLGTFWGLLETVHSISGVIDSMKTGVDTTTMFDDLKQGLSAPIAGMSVSFTSSLFGLASSLILGFLDLQAGQAQIGSIPNSRSFSPATSRRRQLSTRPPRRRSSPKARSPQSNTNATRRRSRR